jgi:DNA modification methylase
LIDPFLGIGTSAVAAYRQKIENFTGIELDEHYLATAKERIGQEQTAIASELGLFD